MNVRYAYSAPITWRMAPSWSIATAPKPGACNNQSAALRVPLTSNRHSSVTERIVPCPAKFNSNSSKPGRLPYKSSLSLSQRLRTKPIWNYEQVRIPATELICGGSAVKHPTMPASRWRSTAANTAVSNALQDTTTHKSGRTSHRVPRQIQCHSGLQGKLASSP